MKLFLDDERPTPDGWERAYTAPEAIALLETGQVTHLSLDHDLGPEEAGTGYDVCKWVEQQVFERAFDFENPFIPPEMTVHSANPVGRKRMEMAILWTYHQFKITQPVAWEKWAAANPEAVDLSVMAAQ